MAREYTIMKKNNIKITKQDLWIKVYKDGIKMKSFSLLADDYARHHAEKYAGTIMGDK